MVKNPPTSAKDKGSIPELGRLPEGGDGNPQQCSCLENPMDREAWQATTPMMDLYLEGFPGGSVERIPLSVQEEMQSPGEGNGNPLQYSCLENPMDREAW